MALSIFIIAFSTFSQASNKVTTTLEISEIMQCQQRHKDRIDYSRCLDSVVITYERQLKTWQNDIEFKLQEVSKTNGRKDAMAIFDVANEEFVSFRKKNCQWQYLAMLPDVSSASIIAKECKIGMTAQRIEDLKEISAFEFY